MELLQRVKYRPWNDCEVEGIIVSGPYKVIEDVVWEVMFGSTNPRAYPKKLEPNETLLFLKESKLYQ